MTVMNTDDLAERFKTAIKSDIAILREICSTDCQLWHSTDNVWMAQGPALDAFIVAQNAGQIGKFDEITTVSTGKGFLAQTSMTMDRLGKMHVAQLMTVKDGKIVSIEEYIGFEMDLSAKLAS